MPRTDARRGRTRGIFCPAGRVKVSPPRRRSWQPRYRAKFSAHRCADRRNLQPNETAVICRAPFSSTFCLLLSPCKITELKSTGTSAGTIVSPGANDWTRETDPIRRFCSSSDSWSVHASLLSSSFIIHVKRNRPKMFPAGWRKDMCVEDLRLAKRRLVCFARPMP
jgi:hypothetical protein